MNSKGFSHIQWEDRLIIDRMLRIGTPVAKIAEGQVQKDHLQRNQARYVHPANV